jgi:flagellar biogenesis protein FliO
MTLNPLFQYFCTTSGIILLLFAFYVYVKRHPQVAEKIRGLGFLQQAGLSTTAESRQLQIVSRLVLEARKTVYVLGYGSERILICTHGDQTRFLSTLSPEQDPMMLPQALLQPEQVLR